MTRRDFLEKIGWGTIVAAVGGLVAALARFFEPNLVTPAPGPVEAGRPEDYAVGSLTFVEKARSYVGRDERGLYAIVAACTHLGCTARPVDPAGTLICPCHGSQFSRDGQVLSGPATKPLPRALVGRGANGRLFVDRSHLVGVDYRLSI